MPYFLSYSSIYIWITSILCVGYAIKILSETNYQLLSKKQNFPQTLFLGILLTFYIGFRPIEGGDNWNYAARFKAISQLPYLDLNSFVDSDGDWMFDYLMKVISSFGSINDFFFLIAIIYVGGHLWACHNIVPTNPYAAFLMCLSSFSFMAFGNNGIRNGAACAIILIAIALILENGIKYKFFAICLCLLAITIHKSATLPAIMMFISILVKDFRFIIVIWGACIIISLIKGPAIANLLLGFGFDDRLDSYINSALDNNTMSQFSKTGFRWDFLLYSSIPIILGYYTIVKKKIESRKYLLLLNTYCLCNAFWALVIYAAFSNRFAYLSWFMYPFVLTYPLLTLNIFNNQASKFSIALTANLLLYLLI